MKQIIFLFSLAFCFLLFSCESKNIDNQEIPEDIGTQDTDSTDSPGSKYISDPIQIGLTANERAMTSDNTNFAMKFFSTIYDNSKSVENIVVSPFSMSMALAVLRNGAEGETKQAIQETMGMKDFPESEINAYFRKLKDALMATDSTLSLAIANSVWYDKNRLTIKKEFENLSKIWYDDSITGLDYSNMKAAVATVNKWCSDNTNGLIKDFFKDDASLSGVEILNALYFKGIWSKGYKFDTSKTFKDEFTKSDGQQVTVDMLHNKLDTKYYIDDFILRSLHFLMVIKPTVFILRFLSTARLLMK
jgi:serpin B